MEEEEEDDAHPDEPAVASLKNLGEDEEGIEEISGNEDEGDEGELQEEEEGVCVCVKVPQWTHYMYNIFILVVCLSTNGERT